MNSLFYALKIIIKGGHALPASETYIITEEKLQQEKIKITLNEGKGTKSKNTVKQTASRPRDF